LNKEKYKGDLVEIWGPGFLQEFWKDADGLAQKSEDPYDPIKDLIQNMKHDNPRWVQVKGQTLWAKHLAFVLTKEQVKNYRTALLNGANLHGIFVSTPDYSVESAWIQKKISPYIGDVYYTSPELFLELLKNPKSASRHDESIAYLLKIKDLNLVARVTNKKWLDAWGNAGLSAY